MQATNHGIGPSSNQESGRPEAEIVSLAFGESFEELLDNGETSNGDTDADDCDETETVSSQATEEDARNLEPRTWAEAEALNNAIRPTMLQFVGITSRVEEFSDYFANYFSQLDFYQRRMNAYWVECRFLSVPPRLVSLDFWTEGIENWESARILHSGLG